MSRTQHRASSGPGTHLIRPACACDLEALKDFFAGLSAQTRYLRFFAPITPTPAMLGRLAGGGNAHAMVATRRGGVIIGHAIAADQACPPGTMTEIGVVVADPWQGHGVGSALVRALIAAARARGVTTIAMDVMASNHKVLAMIAAHWPEARFDQSGYTVTIRAGLPGTQEEPRHAQLTTQRKPGSRRDGRQPVPTTAQLHVGGSRALSGSRP
jgi:GNAT superfamily N-acetyltransferase